MLVGDEKSLVQISNKNLCVNRHNIWLKMYTSEVRVSRFRLEETIKDL